MESLRVWILGVAVASFVAGGVLGHTLGARCADVAASPEQVEYVNDLAARYRLTTEQQRRLRLVLQNFEEKQAAILKSAPQQELPPQLLNRLKALGAKTEQYVRALLDDEQRARYDRDSRPDGLPAGRPDHR